MFLVTLHHLGGLYIISGATTSYGAALVIGMLVDFTDSSIEQSRTGNVSSLRDCLFQIGIVVLFCANIKHFLLRPVEGLGTLLVPVLV